MKKIMLIAAARNLAMLAFVAFPLFLGFAWVQALLFGRYGATDLSFVLETGGFYYLVYIAPVLLGGVCHQLAWFALPATWSKMSRRIAALVLSAVIPLVVIIWGVRAWVVFDLTIPVILSLAVYTSLIRRADSAAAAA